MKRGLTHVDKQWQTDEDSSRLRMSECTWSKSGQFILRRLSRLVLTIAITGTLSSLLTTFSCLPLLAAV